jgi:hypothetical protein
VRSKAARRLLHFYRASVVFFDWSLRFWKNQYRAFRKYFTIYGGVLALLRSPYVHIAFFLTIGCRLRWASTVSASDIAISVIPNLLGFTVGAMAIVLAFSSAPIFKMLAQDGDPKSYFMGLTANLVHFIIVQASALIIGIVGKATGNGIVDGFALFFLFYGVLVTVSAGIQLLQTASLYNAHASLEATKPSDVDERLRERGSSPNTGDK